MKLNIPIAYEQIRQPSVQLSTLEVGDWFQDDPEFTGRKPDYIGVVVRREVSSITCDVLVFNTFSGAQLLRGWFGDMRVIPVPAPESFNIVFDTREVTL